VLGVPQLIEFASRFYTLQPGDVIFTGTPSGVGPIRAGDTVTATITGLGKLSVTVA
jgi:2-keto-4-pentenoate hydratase/2-oxohepta-3-ene-1,7-dioic acid hydratase in catechol pathway